MGFGSQFVSRISPGVSDLLHYWHWGGVTTKRHRKSNVHQSVVDHHLDSTTSVKSGPVRSSQRWNCKRPEIGFMLMLGSESAHTRWCSGMLAVRRSKITVATL